jgi:hypothetical protein
MPTVAAFVSVHMSIDDPQKALEERIAAEEQAASPLMRFVPALARVLDAVPTELLPAEVAGVATGTKWLAKIASSFIAKSQGERREALIEVLSTELRWLKDKVEQTDERVTFMRNEFPSLVLDALEKAEQTRARARIERIGRIIANAAVSGPTKPTDLTDELSRIAMSLDDSDVVVLSELVRAQRTEFNKSLATVPAEAVNNYWRTGDVAVVDKPVQQILPSPLQTAGRLSGVALRLQIPEGELHARCAKLQAFGLTVQVNRNEIKNPPGTLPYAILGRAIDFVDAIRSLAPNE